ncbi:GNAT family N-acetyltransferase [Brevundimonas sp.]|uniref:GNAT family N-acetyltransferase n=1 Tax=Brevundimonas sp. TaxID=1871086 RepID=UPI0035B25BE7
MSNLVRLAAVLALSVAATACSGRVPSDGFKDLHYGMSLDELRSKGFACGPDDYFCGPAPDAEANYTLFGKEASVRVKTAGGKLTLVARGRDGKILAYGDLEPDGHIDHLYAHPEASGRGVAGAVLSALITAAEAQGITELRVEASELARGLFQRSEFSVVQRRDFEIAGVAIHNYAMTRSI